MAPLSCFRPTLRRALTPKPIERRATSYHPCHPKNSSAKRLRDYRRAFGVNWVLFLTGRDTALKFKDAFLKLVPLRQPYQSNGRTLPLPLRFLPNLRRHLFYPIITSSPG
ncbi:uncharacterized protein K441DRAFT_95379 [Cenococcum geophilum 1.58]|uniref:uncharacterized protein n=1 Tax=Cenococcum geophilum 1.58 TaxID=794803 RepID=UPI00358F24AA|nr:hypothetical protein K441DRAFT_95379 [Cenococcum geophilum 1.58]